MSGTMPASSSALITPMWAKPRVPPPPSASATSGRSDCIGATAAWRGARAPLYSVGSTEQAPSSTARTANGSLCMRGIVVQNTVLKDPRRQQPWLALNVDFVAQTGQNDAPAAGPKSTTMRRNDEDPLPHDFILSA